MLSGGGFNVVVDPETGQAAGKMANTVNNRATLCSSALTNASARAQAALYDAVFVQKRLISAETVALAFAEPITCIDHGAFSLLSAGWPALLFNRVNSQRWLGTGIPDCESTRVASPSSATISQTQRSLQPWAKLAFFLPHPLLLLDVRCIPVGEDTQQVDRTFPPISVKVSDHSADAMAFEGLYGWAGWGGSISLVDPKVRTSCDAHALRTGATMSNRDEAPHFLNRQLWCSVRRRRCT